MNPPTKTILFINDEPAVGEFFCAQLTKLNPNWKATFVALPQQLLELTSKLHPDAVLADDYLPKMNGSSLLDEVRSRSPGSLRILMSSGILNTSKLASAHQYLAKPLELPQVVEKLQQAFEAIETSRQYEGFDQIIGLPAFPALPVNLNRLLSLLNDRTDITDAYKLLKQDISMLTKLTQLANSPLFGGADLVPSEDAIARLGVANVRSLVMSINVFKAYHKNASPLLGVQDIWNQCQATAVLAQRLAFKAGLGDEANDAYFAGLVHKLGRLVLMDNHAPEYTELCRRSVEENIPLTKLEYSTFSVSHLEVSEFILNLWGLPANLTKVIGKHEHPWRGLRTPTPSLVTVLYLAEHFAQIRTDSRLPIEPLNQEYLQSCKAESLIAAAEALSTKE